MNRLALLEAEHERTQKRTDRTVLQATAIIEAKNKNSEARRTRTELLNAKAGEEEKSRLRNLQLKM
jgi:hypothetical protein